MVDPTPEPHPHAAATPVRTCLRLLLPLLCVVSVLLLVLGSTGAGVRWLLATEPGTQWLLKKFPMVQAEGFSGALLGDKWHADKLRVQWDGGKQWVLIEGLDASGMQWRWRPFAQAWVGLDMQTLHLRKLTLQTGAPSATSGKPPVLPPDLAPPVQLTVAQAQLDAMVMNGQPLLSALSLQGVALDPRPGALHRIGAFALQASGLAVSGTATLGHAAPFALAAQAAVHPLLDGDAPRWAAALQATGTLPDVALSGTLRGRPVEGREPPAVDLRAGLRPLAAWPLASLNLQTQALDLSALAPQAPSTRLSGQATLSGGEGSTPLAVNLALDNAQPGRWNEHRLPVRKLTLQMSGSLKQPDRLDMTHFDVALSDATQSAGRWSGSAVWQGHGLVLDTVLTGVTPQRLDGRAAAMTLTGPVAATLRGLPSPDPKGNGANADPAAIKPHITWKIDLQGQLDAAPQPVQLTLEGSADDQRLELTLARARAGNASAELRATVARAARNDWQVDTTGKVLNFDPAPWWPGDGAGANNTWRKGPHRLSGDWQFDMRLPADADRLAPLLLAPRVVGNGTLTIHDSVLAGVPLSADIVLGYTQAAAPTTASFRADLRLGGNQILIDARGDPVGNGASDRLRAEIKADTLTALAPLTRLSPALADWVPRQGSLTANVAADGRWPALRAEGTVRVSQLLIGTLGVARGSASAGMDTRADPGNQELALHIDLAGLALGKQRADNLRADLRGTLADHHIDISAALPLLAPQVAEQVLGIQAQSGTRGQMQAQGSWVPDTANGGGSWRTRVEHLVIGSWDGSADTAPPASGWAEARDLKAALQFDANGKLLELHADPGRVRVTDSLGLRWDEVRIDLRPELPLIQLHADIEPFALAPLLARAQPTMGWAGDLRLAARVDVRAAEKMEAEIVFERRDGDLHIVSSEGEQLLGLSEMRLSVSAHEGLWNFSPVFRGRSLGDITGQVQVTTTPEQRWPDAQAPITGSVQARVADISIWSAWVPPGWRLAGEVRTTALIGGTFGAPQFTGEVNGSGLGVRNLLQGVAVTDGQIAVKLAGETAHIERFTLRGGDGTLTVTGNATLGNAPQAKLQIKADHFKVLGRVDRQVVASGNAELSLLPDMTRLDGKLTIDEALFDASRGDAPTLDADVTVRRAGQTQDNATDAGAPKVQRDFAMNVDIDLGGNVRVRGRGLDTALTGLLHVSTPGGRLAVNGTVNAERGTYAAYGQKLEIERGIVAFSGALDNPRLDVLALRPNIDTQVGVAITGNVQSPRVRLYANPDMSDTDKLSWLVLGRAPDGLGRNDTALLQRAAVALLSGEGEAPTDTLMKNLGIDEIGLRQSDGDVRETVITLGKQLSRRWYVGYERGVNATTGTWQLTYRIAQRVTVRAQSGLENALDVIWTWRLQETPPDAAMRKSSITPK